MRYSFPNEVFVGFSLLACYVIRLTSAFVYLKSFSPSFIDAPAKFAVGVNSSGICGALYAADPLDGCSSLRNGFRSHRIDKLRFALIVRGKCSFEDKIRNAQNGGFHVAIVYDDREKKDLLSMIGNPKGIWVHAIFVSKAAGEFLKKHARGKEGECCIDRPREDAAWTVLLISFISLLIILSVLVAILIIRYRQPYRQGPNYYSPRIDTKMVEILPRVIFNSAHSNGCRTRETCAICLEDYKDAEILRVLPCQHDFHVSCVDSWLTKWGTFCPVCKYDMCNDVPLSKVADNSR